MNLKIQKKCFWVFLSLAVATSLFFVVSEDIESIQVQSVYLITTFIASIGAFLAFREFGIKHDNGKVLFLLFLGVSMWSLAEVIWFVYRFFLGIDPYPSIADLFFLLPYPIFALAIFQARKSIGQKLNKKDWHFWTLDFLIGLLLVLTVSYFGIYKAYDSSADSVANILGISYGVVDLLLVVASLFSMTIMREFKKGKLGYFWAVMTVGFFLFLVADVLFAMFNVQYEENLAKPYTYIDLVWVLGYIVLGYGFFDKYIFIKRIKNVAKSITLKS
jgi:hypothetical protein